MPTQTPNAAPSPMFHNASPQIPAATPNNKKEIVCVFVIEGTARMAEYFKDNRFFVDYMEPIIRYLKFVSGLVFRQKHCSKHTLFHRQLRVPIAMDGDEKLQKTKITVCCDRVF